MSVFDKMKKQINSRQNNYPAGSIAGQVVAYDLDANVATVRPLGFEDKLGEEIKVRLGRTDKNVNSPDIHEMATGTEDSRLITPVGGIIQFDAIRKSGDVYEAAWISLLAKDPAKNPVLANTPVRISEIRNKKGETVVDKRGSRVFAVDVYHVDGAKTAKSYDEFKDFAMAALTEGQLSVRRDNTGLAISLLNAEGDLVLRTAHTVGYDSEAEAPRTAEQAFEALLARFEGEDVVKEVFSEAEGGSIEVIPTSRMFIGSKTAQEIEKSLKGGQSPRKVGVDRFQMGETGSGQTIYGTLQANVVMKAHDDGQLFVTHVKPSTAQKPVPLVAINTPAAPEARQAYFEAQKEAAQNNASKAGEDKTAESEKASTKTPDPQGEEIGATVDDDVRSIMDEFDEDDDAPTP